MSETKALAGVNGALFAGYDMMIEFAKLGAAAYISHLDLLRTLQRTLRRGGLPVMFSKGFNPHMILAFSGAVALGHESCGEIATVRLTEPLNADEFVRRINAAMPPGIWVNRAAIIDLKAPAPSSVLDRVDYEISVNNEGVDVKQEIEGFLQKSSIIVQKKTKTGIKPLEVRPLIYSMEYDEGKIRLRLSQKEGASIKPEVVVTELNSSIQIVRIVRNSLYVVDESGVVKPMFDYLAHKYPFENGA